MFGRIIRSNIIFITTLLLFSSASLTCQFSLITNMSKWLRSVEKISDAFQHSQCFSQHGECWDWLQGRVKLLQYSVSDDLHCQSCIKFSVSSWLRSWSRHVSSLNKKAAIRPSSPPWDKILHLTPCLMLLFILKICLSSH